MRPSVALAAALIAALPASARAGRCSGMLERVDSALPAARLSPAQKAELQRLRDEGRALCEQGKDRLAAEKLAEAEVILGLRQSP
jgi:hypothetical protein